MNSRFVQEYQGKQEKKCPIKLSKRVHKNNTKIKGCYTNHLPKMFMLYISSFMSWSNSKPVFAVPEPWRSLSLGTWKRSGLTVTAYNLLTLRFHLWEGMTPEEGLYSENIPIGQGMKQSKSPLRERETLQHRSLLHWTSKSIMSTRQEHSAQTRQDEVFGDNLSTAQ